MYVQAVPLIDRRIRKKCRMFVQVVPSLDNAEVDVSVVCLVKDVRTYCTLFHRNVACSPGELLELLSEGDAPWGQLIAITSALPKVLPLSGGVGWDDDQVWQRWVGDHEVRLDAHRISSTTVHVKVAVFDPADKRALVCSRVIYDKGSSPAKVIKKLAEGGWRRVIDSWAKLL